MTQHPPGDPRFGPPAHSALNLRLLLALFGLVVAAGLAVASGLSGHWVLTIVLGVIALGAAVNAAYVQRRRRARQRAHPDHDYSLFE